MQKILQVRGQIYNEFHRSAGPKYFFTAAANKDDFAAYYTSMYLLQDTAESIDAHRATDFSSNALTSYLEFWGVMQALIIQQDAIKEIHRVIVGVLPNTLAAAAPHWNNIRNFRNQCAGHPANRLYGVPAAQRAFMGRTGRNYSSVTYELWDAHTQQRTHPVVDLGSMIDDYEDEADIMLTHVLHTMQSRWP